MTVKLSKLQSIYDAAYDAEWEKRADKPGSTSVISVIAGGFKKDYVERNFFLCGFNWIEYKLNSKKNRQLHAALKREGARINKGYPSGFSAHLKEKGWHGNGDYYIQDAAYGAVVNYLRDLGYDVHQYSNLD